MVARWMLLGDAGSHGYEAIIQAELRKLLTKGGVICHGLLRREARLAAWRTMLGEAERRLGFRCQSGSRHQRKRNMAKVRGDLRH